MLLLRSCNVKFFINISCTIYINYSFINSLQECIHTQSMIIAHCAEKLDIFVSPTVGGVIAPAQFPVRWTTPD